MTGITNQPRPSLCYRARKLPIQVGHPEKAEVLKLWEVKEPFENLMKAMNIDTKPCIRF